MTTLRSLRLHHQLTLIDLAGQTGIPARTLAEFEYGLRHFDQESRARLAQAFGLPPEALQGVRPRQATGNRRAIWLKSGLFSIVAAMLGVVLALAPGLDRAPAASAAPPASLALAAQPSASRQGRELASISSQPQSVPSQPLPTKLPPTPTPAPRFTLAADGPHGCPLAVAEGHVIMTQGYNEGSHTPTNIWGAVDLAIDRDGDGNAEPETTQGIPIAATLGGVAHVFMGSWPGGNFVRVTDERAGWSTAYAHLDTVAVADGQLLSTGATLGTVGSTGMTSGPHLHYEIWHGGENIDPTELIGCH